MTVDIELQTLSCLLFTTISDHLFYTAEFYILLEPVTT